MQDAQKERRLELCAQAAVEQESKKLAALVAEIARLLREKEDRPREQNPQ